MEPYSLQAVELSSFSSADSTGYSEISGRNPKTPASIESTDMHDLEKYVRQLIDEKGPRLGYSQVAWDQIMTDVIAFEQDEDDRNNMTGQYASK